MGHEFFSLREDKNAEALHFGVFKEASVVEWCRGRRKVGYVVLNEIEVR